MHIRSSGCRRKPSGSGTTTAVRGDPELIADRMRPPAPVGAPVIRADPREAHPLLRATAAGMAAAPPRVDAFVEGLGLAAPERPAAVARGADDA